MISIRSTCSTVLSRKKSLLMGNSEIFIKKHSEKSETESSPGKIHFLEFHCSGPTGIVKSPGIQDLTWRDSL